MKGSHNSLTFARPLRWWAWLVVPFWRCQRKNIKEQVAGGIRAFDIRFVWRDGKWISAHGAVDLLVYPLLYLEYLENICPGAFVRCILEKGDAGAQLEFIRLCKELPARFPALHFFEGIYKPRWERIHDFGDEATEIQRTERQHYGSHYAWWKGAIPRLWWWLHRRDCIDGEDSDGHPIVFKDFV